jgi:hypothetical protein
MILLVAAATVSACTFGDYEVTEVLIYESGPSTIYSPVKPFSIPFTVRPGGAVYLGNYQANGLYGKSLLGWKTGKGAVFVVEDRARQDLQIARTADPTLPTDVEDATPDVDKIASPLFVQRWPPPSN